MSQEESETWIGEWMKARGNRDRMVIATKYTVSVTFADRTRTSSQADETGNRGSSPSSIVGVGARCLLRINVIRGGTAADHHSTTSYRGHALGKNEAANHAGNSKKSMFNSVKDSLKKLQTDYVSSDAGLADNIVTNISLLNYAAGHPLRSLGKHIRLLVLNQARKTQHLPDMIFHNPVGPHDLHRGNHGLAPHPRRARQGSLPWCL